MRCRTAFLVFQNSSFCNSFLQHHPTPLAGHRQEKTEKTRFEQEKADGSAEPSAKTGILSLSDTYTHPQWRQFPWEYRSLRPDTWKSSLLSKDSGGLQKQHQHHHRGNIADHHPVELLAAEGLAAPLHLVNDVIRRHDPADQDGGQ